MLLTFSLQMDLRKRCDIVDPGHPVFPFEDIDRVFCESEKGREVCRNGLSALEDARGWMCPGDDVNDVRVEELAGR